jgi:LEA14-like dessication related protein
MTKHRNGAAAVPALAAATLGALTFLSSCATKPVEPPKAAAPRARISALGAVPLDQHRTRLAFSVEALNPGKVPLSLESCDCVLYADGAEAGRARVAARPRLEPDGSATLPFELVADARSLGGAYAKDDGPAEAPFRIEAKLSFLDGGGGRVESSTSLEGTFPIVKEPRFKIVSLKIERDILVTTNLRLTLEARNPNAFAVRLGDFDYTFDGEGKGWASGKTPGPFEIPARSSKKIELAFEMNFADRDRSLFDLVAKLQVVRYRLVGAASVAAEPSGPKGGSANIALVFPLRFDESGSCQVER